MWGRYGGRNNKLYQNARTQTYMILIAPVRECIERTLACWKETFSLVNKFIKKSCLFQNINIKLLLCLKSYYLIFV